MLIDLQLFAGDLPGVEDDNPTALEEAEEDISGLFEEEEEEEEVTPEQEAPAEEQAQEELPRPRLFTEADVNRIVQERLARDRKAKMLRELEQRTGLSLEQILEKIKENEIQQIADEKGISEEDARAIVEMGEQQRRMAEELEAQREYQKNLARTMAYSQEKQKYINNPLVKRYEAEIDAFAQNGLLLDFVPAMNYVLGQHVLAGDLLSDVKAATEKQVLANVSKRSRVVPESQGVALAQGVALTPEQKRFAKLLGVSERDYAEELQKIQRQRKGR